MTNTSISYFLETIVFLGDKCHYNIELYYTLFLSIIIEVFS